MDLAIIFMSLGGLFLAGLVADEVGRRTSLPRVTLLLACGLAAGESGFDALPDEARQWYEFLSVLALTLVAFLLGSALRYGTLVRHGRAIMSLSITVVLATVVIVGGGLAVLGVPLGLALLLGAIATATDPAATADVIRQSNAAGPFVNTLKGVVAIDDAWGLLAFSLVVVAVSTFDGGPVYDIIRSTMWEVGGAVALGFLLGLPAAALTGRLQPGEPSQAEALGTVFLSAGLSLWLEVSFLIAGMTAGAVIANLARHHNRAFHEIENIRWPFMILFFVLAGASLDVGKLAELGLIGLGYVLLRIAARVAGGWIGGLIGGLSRTERRWVGAALMPQAGVAVGMALVATKAFPEYADTILTLTIATTVIFEIVGPASTLLAIRKVAAKTDYTSTE